MFRVIENTKVLTPDLNLFQILFILYFSQNVYFLVGKQICVYVFFHQQSEVDWTVVLVFIANENFWALIVYCELLKLYSIKNLN